MEKEKLTAEEIAKKLGINLDSLLEQYGDEENIVEMYKSGELQILND